MKTTTEVGAKVGTTDASTMTSLGAPETVIIWSLLKDEANSIGITTGEDQLEGANTVVGAKGSEGTA
jgi:hypothetical protein